MYIIHTHNISVILKFHGAAISGEKKKKPLKDSQGNDNEEKVEKQGSKGGPAGQQEEDLAL